jgi:hypothetical protein
LIDQLDDALKEFLVRELPVRENEIDISFDQPRREWSARLNRPTLNLFLHDIRENAKLRSPQPGNQVTINGNLATLTRMPVRIDLHYMATAWARDPLDEHRILSRMLAAMFRFRSIPEEVVAQFVAGQENGVPIKLAQYDTQSGSDDLWSVLDNEVRPAIDMVLTMTIHPAVEVTLPLVREVDIQYNQLRPGQMTAKKKGGATAKGGP